MTHVQRPEGSGKQAIEISEQSAFLVENSLHKGLKAGAYLVCQRKSKDDSEQSESGAVRGDQKEGGDRDR